MTTAFEGRRLAQQIESAVPGEPIDLSRVAYTLRALADAVESTLQAANALAGSMDAVHADRVMLVKKVNQLKAELACEKRRAEEPFY